MAITPTTGVAYCENTSGAKIEWQDPDRDVAIADYAWNDGLTYNAAQMPIKITSTAALATLVDTVSMGAGGSDTTSVALEKNKFYTLVVSGFVTVSGTQTFDACFVVDDGEVSPSPYLTINDELFANLFYEAAEKKQVVYDPTRQYSIGFIGNDSTVTFSLGGAGTGAISIEIYENEYRLLVTTGEGAGETTLYDQTRSQPYYKLNLACGGDCPTRTSFPCECSNVRHCYWDDDEGSITKIFFGEKYGE